MSSLPNYVPTFLLFSLQEVIFAHCICIVMIITERCDTARPLLILCSMMPHGSPEISHGGNIYTMGISEHYEPEGCFGFWFSRQVFIKLVPPHSKYITKITGLKK